VELIQEEAFMTTTTMEKELLAVEREYWDAIKEKDIDTVVRLTADKAVVVGAQGITELDKDTLSGMMMEQPWELKKYALDKDMHVLPLGKDIAMIAYKVKEDMTVEGKLTTLEAHDASVWLKQDGKWVCALHTESLAGDPFGRDKSKSK
jgi:ketosteroid isomerase-like protein